MGVQLWGGLLPNLQLCILDHAYRSHHDHLAPPPSTPTPLVTVTITTLQCCHCPSPTLPQGATNPQQYIRNPISTLRGPAAAAAAHAVCANNYVYPRTSNTSLARAMQRRRRRRSQKSSRDGYVDICSAGLYHGCACARSDQLREVAEQPWRLVGAVGAAAEGGDQCRVNEEGRGVYSTTCCKSCCGGHVLLLLSLSLWSWSSVEAVEVGGGGVAYSYSFLT